MNNQGELVQAVQGDHPVKLKARKGINIVQLTFQMSKVREVSLTEEVTCAWHVFKAVASAFTNVSAWWNGSNLEKSSLCHVFSFLSPLVSYSK